MSRKCHQLSKLLQITTNDIKEISHKTRDLVKKTPLERNDRLSKRYGADIYLKREDLQIPRCFKIRGAYHKIMNIPDLKHKKIVCASAGNHAQGVALTCKHLNVPCTIYLPSKTPQQKINRIRHHSNDECEIVLYGEQFNDCLEKAMEISKGPGMVFVHPYNDADIISGQATVGYEIYDELNPDMIITAIGGGGLISGISLYSKQVNKDCRLIGVEPDTCPSMTESIKQQEIITYPVTDNFVDGATVNRVGHLTYEITKKNIDSLLQVETGKICETMLDLYTDDGIVCEPAGALAISALDQLNVTGLKVVCLLSGGNNDITRYPEVMNRMLSYKNLKHYYLVEFAQKPGELKSFINHILGPNDDIIRFEYIKKTNVEKGNVLIGIEVEKSENRFLLEKNLETYGFNFIRLKDNNILYNYLV